MERRHFPNGSWLNMVVFFSSAKCYKIKTYIYQSKGPSSPVVILDIGFAESKCSQYLPASGFKSASGIPKSSWPQTPAQDARRMKGDEPKSYEQKLKHLFCNNHLLPKQGSSHMDHARQDALPMALPEMGPRSPQQPILTSQAMGKGSYQKALPPTTLVSHTAKGPQNGRGK